MVEKTIPSGSGVPSPEGQTPKTEVKETPKAEETTPNPETEALKSELSNLQKVIGKQGKELGDLRKQNAPKEKKDEVKNYDALETDIVTKLDAGELDLKTALREMNKLATERGAKMATEQIRDEQNKQRSQDAVNQFKAQNTDYDQVLESGALDEIMNSNPLHDTFSAYYEHKGKTLQSEMETRVAEAKKEGEQEGLKIASESKNPSKVLGKKGDDIRDKAKQPYGNRTETKSAMADALKRSRQS